MMSRRTALARSSAFAACLGAGCRVQGEPIPQRQQQALPALFDDLEHRTFLYFWELANRSNGLVPDRWPTPSFCSIAAVGYALTCYPIGVERGWCTREEARDLTLTTLRFFWNAPQGPGEGGFSGHKGFFYHFIDMNTGWRFGRVELSTSDSSILFLGMLFAAAYFDRGDAQETEIRKLAHDIYARADWLWFQAGREAIPMGWHPETGFIARNWDGYNEGMMVFLLAMGAPEHAIDDKSWSAWTTPYPRFWRGEGDSRHLAFAPLFGHHFSHVWIDFRGIQDATMREAGFDYFENSRRATYANRAYCIENPMGWDGYSENIWGLSACDGPGTFQLDFKGNRRRFEGYYARGPIGQPDGMDDGTIAPAAALGSLPFAPEIVVPCAEAMHREYGARLFSKYGFLDAFNPSFKYQNVEIQRGTVDPQQGWVDSDYVGIDQGAILTMAANYRSDFVWKYMRKVEPLRLGLQRAGFTGGWLG